MSASAAPAAQPQLPRAFELVELLDRILSDWAFLTVSPLGRPAAGPAELPLEFSCALRGSLPCLLVLRSSHAFGAELAYASTGDPGAREQGGDAFRELCNLLSSHLLSQHLGGEKGDFAPFLPSRSQPTQWPAAAPDVEAALLVENFPLEARLWLLPAGEAGHA